MNYSAKYDCRRVLLQPSLRLCLALVLFASGCTSPETHRKIVAVPLTVTGVPMLTERTGLDEAASQAHLEVDWNGPTERNAQIQVDRIQEAIRGDAYGVVVTPYSSFGLNTSIRTALSKNIPVVVVDSPLILRPSPHLSFVLEDMPAGAALMQKELDQVLHGRGRIGILGIDPLSNGSDARADALAAALSSQSPEIVVASRVRGPINTGYLEIAAEKMLREHPDLDAIVAMTGRAGTSAAAAIRALHPTHAVHLLAYDGTLEMTLLIRHGQADAILVQDLRGMGFRAIKNIVADRHGKPVTASMTFAPTLVTRENLDHEAVQHLMEMHWGKS
jgi:ribose transport system substrate-binding protein